MQWFIMQNNLSVGVINLNTGVNTPGSAFIKCLTKLVCNYLRKIDSNLCLTGVTTNVKTLASCGLKLSILYLGYIMLFLTWNYFKNRLREYKLKKFFQLFNEDCKLMKNLWKIKAIIVKEYYALHLRMVHQSPKYIVDY